MKKPSTVKLVKHQQLHDAGKGRVWAYCALCRDWFTSATVTGPSGAKLVHCLTHGRIKYFQHEKEF